MKEKDNYQEKKRLDTIKYAAQQVGRPVINAVLIIIITFLPVFLLSGR